MPNVRSLSLKRSSLAAMKNDMSVDLSVQNLWVLPLSMSTATLQNLDGCFLYFIEDQHDTTTGTAYCLGHQNTTAAKITNSDDLQQKSNACNNNKIAANIPCPDPVALLPQQSCR